MPRAQKTPRLDRTDLSRIAETLEHLGNMSYPPDSPVSLTLTDASDGAFPILVWLERNDDGDGTYTMWSFTGMEAL